MSFEEEFQKFAKEQLDSTKPEDIFKLITIIPSRKIRVKAWLKDKDGDRIEIAEVAENIVKYVKEKMGDTTNNPVNVQIFPLIAQLMLSYIPRAMGLGYAQVAFALPAFRDSFIHMGVAAFLMMQYIKQHDLTIETEEEEITDQELAALKSNDEEMRQRVEEALEGAFNLKPDKEHDDDLN